MLSLKSRFARRVNTDGSTDSICCTCYVTVATASKEYELAGAERNHVCDPVLVKHWKDIAAGKRKEDFTPSERCSFCFALGN